MRCIGIIGPEGAGKTTAARILECVHGYQRVPFAAPLKRMIEALGVDPKHLYGTPADKAAPLAIFGGKSARHAMQTLGTEWGRVCIGDGFWGDAWEVEADKYSRVVADDVRFPNEAERMRRRGGIVICIVRGAADATRKPRHASEDFLAVPFDHVVVNDGTVEQLADALAHILAPHLAVA